MSHYEDKTVVPSQRGYVREVLSRIDMFRQLPAELLEELAGEFRSAKAEPGEVLVRQGDPGDQLFVVDEGSLDVTAELNGRTVPLGRLTRGDVFGEFALISGKPRTATVTASTAAHLWTLSAASFQAWMNRSPAMAASVRGVMKRRAMANALKALQ